MTSSTPVAVRSQSSASSRGERRAGVGGRDVCGGVVVDPRAAREVVEGDDAGVKRMAVAGDDARGEVDEALAAQEPRQRFAVVDAAAVEIGLAGGEQAQPLCAGGGVEPQLDAGKRVAEPGDGGRQDGVEPHGARGDA